MGGARPGPEPGARTQAEETTNLVTMWPNFVTGPLCPFLIGQQFIQFASIISCFDLRNVHLPWDCHREGITVRFGAGEGG